MSGFRVCSASILTLAAMIAFDWFDAKAAKRFGTELAEAFAKAVPVEANLPDKKFSRKAEAALTKMHHMVVDFKALNRLNVYKKAQLGNSFKWSLRDAGFDSSYVDRLTEWLVERL